MESFETLAYEEKDGVAVVTLNRPEVHNAFNYAMQLELRSLWTSLRTNDDIRVVVLTGAGNKAFCTGIDRTETIQQAYIEGKKTGPSTGPVSTPFMYNDPGGNLNPKQNDLWKPIVAAINGMACGGALYMLGEVDIIIAAEHATFFDPHVSYGMVAGFESTHLLQKLPLGETLRVALLGANERMSAQRAYQLGLVSEVVPADELLEKAMWIASKIASTRRCSRYREPSEPCGPRTNCLVRPLWNRSPRSYPSGRTENIESGQRSFESRRIEWKLR